MPTNKGTRENAIWALLSGNRNKDTEKDCPPPRISDVETRPSPQGVEGEFVVTVCNCLRCQRARGEI